MIRKITIELTHVELRKVAQVSHISIADMAQQQGFQREYEIMLVLEVFLKFVIWCQQQVQKIDCYETNHKSVKYTTSLPQMYAIKQGIVAVNQLGGNYHMPEIMQKIEIKI
jgi:hypothetical protein